MTKEELRECRDRALYIKTLEEKLLELEDLARKVSPSLKKDMVDSSPNQDKLGETVTRIVELQALINREIGILKQKEKEVLLAISKLPSKEKRLMFLRYVYGLSWEEVAVEMGYSWRQIHNIHSNSLKKIKK